MCNGCFPYVEEGGGGGREISAPHQDLKMCNGRFLPPYVCVNERHATVNARPRFKLL